MDIDLGGLDSALDPTLTPGLELARHQTLAKRRHMGPNSNQVPGLNQGAGLA